MSCNVQRIKSPKDPAKLLLQKMKHFLLSEFNPEHRSRKVTVNTEGTLTALIHSPPVQKMDTSATPMMPTSIAFPQPSALSRVLVVDFRRWRSATTLLIPAAWVRSPCRAMPGTIWGRWCQPVHRAPHHTNNARPTSSCQLPGEAEGLACISGDREFMRGGVPVRKLTTEPPLPVGCYLSPALVTQLTLVVRAYRVLEGITTMSVQLLGKRELKRLASVANDGAGAG